MEDGKGRAFEGGRRRPVLIVDALPVVRAGLELLMADSHEFEVLGTAGSSEEAVEMVRTLNRRSDLMILIGLGLRGDHDSFWLLRALREEHPSCRLVVCGANSDKSAASRALFFGADGFVDKNAQTSRFLDDLRRCARGEVVVSGGKEDWIEGSSDAAPNASHMLTSRQREILLAASEGLTARQIGERLGLRERTVTTHLARVYMKLGVSGRAAAVAAALRMGIVVQGEGARFRAEPQPFPEPTSPTSPLFDPV